MWHSFMFLKIFWLNFTQNFYYSNTQLVSVRWTGERTIKRKDRQSHPLIKMQDCTLSSITTATSKIFITRLVEVLESWTVYHSVANYLRFWSVLVPILPIIIWHALWIWYSAWKNGQKLPHPSPDNPKKKNQKTHLGDPKIYQVEGIVIPKQEVAKSSAKQIF